MAATTEPTTITVDVPISYGGTSITTSWISAQFTRAFNPDTLVIMVPGATETSDYFEFEYKSETYNSALYLRRRGYSTLTVDRLGTGKSGKPLSRKITTVAQSTALHTLIQEVRDGKLGWTPTNIVVLGHSIGSMIAIVTQSIYRDIDALVLTGYAHAPASEPIIAALYSTFIPAPDSTELHDDGYDPGYLTHAPLPPEPTATPPDVTQYARSIMSVVSGNEADAVHLTVESRLTDLIDIPVFLGVGGNDAIFCSALSPGNDCTNADTLAETEAPRFPNAPVFTSYVLPGADHTVQLDANAPMLNAAICAWLDTNI